MGLIEIKREIEKLREELEREIKSSGKEGLCIDNKLYKLSTDIDALINVYIKEQQKAGSQ